MKKYIFLAASALTLASCSSDDFLGDTPGSTPSSANSAIKFDGNAGKITRATKNTGTPAEMLDYQLKIYGVKKESDGNLKSVFVNYSVWDAAANTTTSNTKGWEYVGTKEGATYGTSNISLDKDQTIKFWDYSASEYRFVAGSPISAFTYDVPVPVANESKEIKSATIKGLAGHINPNNSGTALTTNPVYIADPIIVPKAKYNNAVQFSFKRQQAMVRVGFYETIPGYTITEINFYDADGKVQTIPGTDGNTSKGTNIILYSGTEDYFAGGNNVEGTINYIWTGTTPSYTYAYTKGLTKSKNWYAGKLETLATTSTESVEALYGKDADMSTKGYFTVLPTPTATEAAPIFIKCDYTLTSTDYSGETIKVTGATAAVPAAFSKWEANTMYTYIFKISQNTNGTTGKPDDKDPAGLYPITFDAAVKQSTDAQGTVTTVSTPSITTYQDGSVTDNGIEYKSGKAIYATATNDKGKEFTLTTNGTAVGNVQVYKLSKERNEAELQVSEVVKAEITNGIKITTTVHTTEITVGNVKLAANKYLSFTPTETGFYAIQYLVKAAEGTTPAVYAYKVVEVK